MLLLLVRCVCTCMWHLSVWPVFRQSKVPLLKLVAKKSPNVSIPRAAHLDHFMLLVVFGRWNVIFHSNITACSFGYRRAFKNWSEKSRDKTNEWERNKLLWNTVEKYLANKHQWVHLKLPCWHPLLIFIYFKSTPTLSLFKNMLIILCFVVLVLLFFFQRLVYHY